MPEGRTPGCRKAVLISLAAKYAFFAAVATGANLGAQYLSLAVYSREFSLYAAMALGTLAGLIVKYILDREYIFRYRAKSRMDDMGKFVLYSLMGVFTTFIFWGFELAFHAVFRFDEAKYVGALAGLAIGYFIKYQLDKRFVFVKEESV